MRILQPVKSVNNTSTVVAAANVRTLTTAPITPSESPFPPPGTDEDVGISPRVHHLHEMRLHIERLTETIKALSDTTDEQEADAVIKNLERSTVEDALNRAQTLYTLTFLHTLDTPFATLLATRLCQYFTSHGKDCSLWDSFVSAHQVP